MFPSHVIDASGKRLPLYEYHSLTSNPLKPESNRNLRLIHLHPAAQKTESLNCTLQIVNADNAPRYEALSWCWVKEPREKQKHMRVAETITRDNETQTVVSIKLIPSSLERALKTLRWSARSRTLWVDLICINQDDLNEKNTQVPMMHKIYGNAENVCIWLDEPESFGEETVPTRKRRRIELDDDPSEDDRQRYERKAQEKRAELLNKVAEQDKKAMTFIEDDVLRLWNFDELCKNKAKAQDWAALLSLMRKPWFSRRWVVQEIALAKDAEIYTAKGHIAWRDFVDAVSLFVEVEDASRRLTEIMQQHEVYNHVPDFFEDLSAIGASMLVKATSNLYRGAENGKRDSQKTLESLISALPVFDVSDPRDAVYSLLAISKDTSPLAANQEWNLKLFQRIVENSLDKDLTRQTFRVDYRMKVVDVFQEFIAFSIRRSMSTDPTRALDILCRAWAPDPQSTQNQSSGTPNGVETVPEKLPSWIMGPDQAAFKIYNHPNVGRRMGRINADSLVGLPDENRPYRAAESKAGKIPKFKKCNTFYSLSVEGFELDRVGKVETFSQNGQIPWDWINAAGWQDTDNDPPPEEFWRTLVADRSDHGRNALPFFERACHESIKKERSGETIDTKKLINEGRCSIVAAYLRRVHAVIWNRRLAKSARTNRLCMTPKATRSGDRICVFYGCSVPVILRPRFKTDDELEDEVRLDEAEFNKPREKAARKIADLFRREQRRKQRAQQVNGNDVGRTVKIPTQEELDRLAKKKDRWEAINNEIVQIKEDEEAELLKKIREAQQTPADDPRRQYFEFIGPCYVHGMMNGEAIEEQNSESIPISMFEIH